MNCYGYLETSKQYDTHNGKQWLSQYCALILQDNWGENTWRFGCEWCLVAPEKYRLPQVAYKSHELYESL